MQFSNPNVDRINIDYNFGGARIQPHSRVKTAGIDGESH
jgi:hypothetical protein